MEKLKELLNNISKINEKYEEIAKISGENFNVFNLFGKTNHELSHSIILKELLDPQGSHDSGDCFLKLFIELLKEKENNNGVKLVFENFDTKAEVSKEFPTENGRIDIVIKSKSNIIFLENKIWAGEQPDQLLRYWKELDKKNLRTNLLYLTLDGKEATTAENETIKSDYTRLSYEKDILKWIESCREKSADKPILRETLTQYILLIKQLTGQTRRDKMSREIFKEIVKNKETFKAANIIEKEFVNAKIDIFNNKFLPILENICKELKNEGYGEWKPEKCKKIGEEKARTAQVTDKWFRVLLINEEQMLRINFEFGEANLSKLAYGIVTKNNKEEVTSSMKSFFNNCKDWWCYYKEIFMNDEDFFTELALAQRESNYDSRIKEKLKTEIKKLVKEIDDYKKEKEKKNVIRN